MFLLQAGLTSDGVFTMIRDLGLLAQVVLVILAVFSVLSWAVIVDRAWLFRKARKEGTRFLEAFRNASKFSQVRAACEKLDTTPLSAVFKAGYGEISSQLEGASRSGSESGGRRIDMEALERSLIQAAHAERRRLERMMLFLATTGAATPFIGLFGTVWGIMNSFQSIAAYGNADLAVVAPGISEALLTTAAGLAAAIPAVIAYNHLQGRIRALSGDMEDFGLEFLNVVQKTWKRR